MWPTIETKITEFAEAPIVAHMELCNTRQSEGLMYWNEQNVKFRGDIKEYLCVGYPNNSNGESKIVDGLIHLTCDDGFFSRDPTYRLILAPAPENAPYYAGFASISIDSIQPDMKAAGYSDLAKMKIKRMPCTTGVGQFNNISIAISLAKLLDKKPGLLRGSGLNKERLFRTFIGRTQQYGYWYPKTVLEGKIAKIILRELWPAWDCCVSMAQNYNHRSKISSFFGLQLVEDVRTQTCVILMPPRLFEATTKLVEAGWGPITPLWLGPFKHQFNMNHIRGCGGGIMRDQKGVLGWYMQRMFKHCIGEYNLHPEQSLNYTNIRPSQEWEDTFVKACEDLSRGNPKDYTNRVRCSIGLQACRDIPVVVSQSDVKDLQYWRLRGLVEKSETHEGTKVREIEVVDQDGDLITNRLDPVKVEEGVGDEVPI